MGVVLPAAGGDAGLESFWAKRKGALSRKPPSVKRASGSKSRLSPAPS